MDLQASDPIFNEIRKHPLLEKKWLLAMLADHDKRLKKDMDYCDQIMRDWQTYYNAEPFWGQVCSTDLVTLARSRDFCDIDEGYKPTPIRRGLRNGSFTRTPHQSGSWWYVISAVKS